MEKGKIRVMEKELLQVDQDVFIPFPLFIYSLETENYG